MDQPVSPNADPRSAHDEDDPDSPHFNPSEEDWLADYQASTRRCRHDGWTPDRQYSFLLALAQSGCVVEACRAVGKAPASAYRLRRDSKSGHFRRAWDAALDHAVARLSDAAIGRALNGTARPVFFKGEQVGERRYYDERLTMFILRYRDPARYGKWLDRMMVEQPADGPTFIAEHYARRAHEDALAWELGLKPRPSSRLPIHQDSDAPGYEPLEPGNEPVMDYGERPVTAESDDLDGDSWGADDSGWDVP